jgi:hypothetical protein
MNKVRKSRVEHVKEMITTEPTVEKWKTEKLFIEEVCSSSAKLSSEAESPKDLNISGHQVHDFLADLAHPCNKMLLR